MLTEERKRLILDRLKVSGRIIAKNLSEELGLSEDTIRRDLREMAGEGLLQRVHGGALPASPTVVNLASRRDLSIEEKKLLARFAVKHLQPRQSYFIDGGTTNLEIVQALSLSFEAKVFTHSPTIAAAFEGFPNVELTLIGGRLYKHSMVTLGVAAARTIVAIRVDMFLMGLTGLHKDEGVTTGDCEEAAMKALIASRAAEVISVVSAEKIGAVSDFQIGKLSMLTKIFATKNSKLDV